MGKNKAAAEKKLKKAAKEAVASGREIKRERNDLKRKANQVPDRLVSFKTIHYLDEPGVENLDAIRKSLIEKATQRAHKRFKRDLQKLINQLLEAQAQTHTQVMRDQQAHQEQQLILHQQLQDAMNQLTSQQPVELQRDTERRVEGLSMPAYHGNHNECIGLYIHRAKTFVMAKNLNYEQNEVVEARCLAMVVANLQGQAAAWYQELASRRVNGGFRTLVNFEQALREEFEPDNLQERLRDPLFTL
ncbi:hypothetical protein DYB28_014407 [Aphanomyces astaci]|uniref:Retrotransposon gag domain-containing protein n=1 Tax=Aphanomyces astaci TaxID=112090 RepID=A0A9X8EAY4_APHAT|nr:hypothetical protein DYB28_014407 [Aphanomyces astaci]